MMSPAFRFSFASLVAGSLLISLTAPAEAAPIQKRIAQTISDSTTAWVAACTKAGGGQQCNPLSVTAFTTLLAAGQPCAQQDAADSMLDLAKTLGSDAEMVRLAQLFAQQPRNAPDSLAVPYCQRAPRNAELAGLYHCQFAGADQAKFSGDQSGNLPLGVEAVSPPGSCPALNKPVPDGAQLNTLVTDPKGSVSSAAVPASASGAVFAASTASSIGAAVPSAVLSAAGIPTTDPAAPVVSTALGAGSAMPSMATSAPGAASSSAASFQLANGQAAQQLNAQFAALQASDACTAGSQACVSGGFAQCVGGAWAVQPCSAGTQCFALPLVNKPGTSITCDTAPDALARIAATGAQGGVDGAGAAASAAPGSSAAPLSSVAPAASGADASSALPSAVVSAASASDSDALPPARSVFSSALSADAASTFSTSFATTFTVPAPVYAATVTVTRTITPSAGAPSPPASAPAVVSAATAASFPSGFSAASAASGTA